MDLLWLEIFIWIICVGILTYSFVLLDCDFTLQAFVKCGNSSAALTGKVVWITGASSGIGEGLAYELAAAGCRLVLSARREELLKKVKKKCLVTGNLKEKDILVLPVDLLAYDTHTVAMETVVRHFKTIDILVNNAGRSQRALCQDTSLGVDKQMLDINVLGPLSLTKAVLPQFHQQGHGHVVVISSVAGKLGAPGLGSYSASKHALQGWFDCLRIEGYTRNIQVTVVCPGPVDTLSQMYTSRDNGNEFLEVESKPEEYRMSRERCTYLIAVATANNLEEAWISRQPILTYLYLFQYFPSIAKWFSKRLGQRRIKAIEQIFTSLPGSREG